MLPKKTWISTTSEIDSDDSGWVDGAIRSLTVTVRIIPPDVIMRDSACVFMGQ